MNPDRYFKTARERFRIKNMRASGFPREAWTQDPIFQDWRFCNVHREDDKTTVWFRENIRQHLSGHEALHATFIFRWFNRIETAEKILDLIIEDGSVPKWDAETCLERLYDVHPVITGAYMVATPNGFTKLGGVLEAIDMAFPMLGQVDLNVGTLEGVWNQLNKLPWVGNFTAYEIVTDLRHCEPLCNATDIMTWANPGPGAIRGITALTGREFNRGDADDRHKMLVVMQKLLAASQNPYYWPKNYKSWEMREVEHWLCEFMKYENARNGLRLKRRF